MENDPDISGPWTAAVYYTQTVVQRKKIHDKNAKKRVERGGKEHSSKVHVISIVLHTEFPASIVT